MIATHALDEVVAAGNAPSVRWLQHQIRAGRVTARKIGRTWRMTNKDVEDMLDARRNVATHYTVELSNSYGLTARSARRRTSSVGR